MTERRLHMLNPYGTHAPPIRILLAPGAPPPLRDSLREHAVKLGWDYRPVIHNPGLVDGVLAVADAVTGLTALTAAVPMMSTPEAEYVLRTLGFGLDFDGRCWRRLDNGDLESSHVVRQLPPGRAEETLARDLAASSSDPRLFDVLVPTLRLSRVVSHVP